eukprot:TRINITY_DN20254_c0_g1_i2.p1 TRINITY_DN20254_c0_g1~~TRINITY_DN20254_c0_g1_i2.p1  ORF type:complete len:887 (-),score=165.05 TRINITY_DN20254_c0_g1_i2:158-2818(-)
MAASPGFPESATCSDESLNLLAPDHLPSSNDATPRSGEISLASSDYGTPRCSRCASESWPTSSDARGGKPRAEPLDCVAASPESFPATDANDFDIVSGDGNCRMDTDCFGGQICTNMEDPDAFGSIASADGEPSQDEEELQEMPLKFYSRIDGKDHIGQLIRNVELLGRRYLVVRSEPSPEEIRHGMKSIIRVFGMGYLNPQNDDIVMLGGASSEQAADDPLSLGARNGTSFGTSHRERTCSDEVDVARHDVELRVKEPGIFVPDSKRFQQKELLGSGGFADVYRYVELDAAGRHLETYAVKEVDLQHLSWKVGVDQERLVRWVARLEIEVRNLLKLRGHPGVVKVHDAFAYRNRFYIVMEQISGTDLGRRLKGRGRISEVEARGLFAQMAEALRHSHALDVVHRDLKPHNILLAHPLHPGQTDLVKLIDFGLSKDIGGSSSGTSTPFLGTKYYRAPETRQAIPGQENFDDAKVDVFALGVTLYAMLAGSHPPEGEEVTQLTLRGEAWGRVSAEARDLLLGLLKHEPDQRLSLDDVIEHPWLSVSWGAEAKCEPHAKGAEEAQEDESDINREIQGMIGPSFPSAFPDAPVSSSAARILAVAGGNQHGSPETSSTAPGWGNVLSWMHAGAASAAAQEVLCKAGEGKSSAPSAAFGRPTLVGGRSAFPAGNQDVIRGAEPRRKSAGAAAPSWSPSKLSEDSVEAGSRTAGGASMSRSQPGPEEPRMSVDVEKDEQGTADDKDSSNANTASGVCRIKWLSCAPRFASVWRFSQALAPSPSPSPPPLPLPSPSARESETLTATSMDGTTTEPPAPPARERRPSVIGFVQAPRLSAVDGLMVTITHSQRGSKPARAWGFVSELCRGHGYATREDAMRAAEIALLGCSSRPG